MELVFITFLYRLPYSYSLEPICIGVIAYDIYKP